MTSATPYPFGRRSGGPSPGQCWFRDQRVALHAAVEWGASRAL